MSSVKIGELRILQLSTLNSQLSPKPSTPATALSPNRANGSTSDSANIRRLPSSSRTGRTANRNHLAAPRSIAFTGFVQGTGRAVAWTPPPQPSGLVAGPVKLPARAQSMRTWILGRLPFAPVGYETWDGAHQSLVQHSGQPLLLNLWSASCAPCVEELAEWSKANARLKAAKLQILALTVDGTG